MKIRKYSYCCCVGVNYRSNLQEARAKLGAALKRKNLLEIGEFLKDYEDALKFSGISYDPSGMLDQSKAQLAALQKISGKASEYFTMLNLKILN